MKTVKPALSAVSVSKNYETNTVLSNVSLEVRPGEWLAILGESGSGKSTLLKILARFTDADAGDVFFKGAVLPAVHTRLIAGHESIRLIHQEFELFPNQTVEENISYSLRFYEPEYRKEKVAELLAVTRLELVKDRKAKYLSGGEKQRTAIAKAIAEQPDVLLLDEPFAHLDNHNRRVLAEAIEEIRHKHHMACIFVTHEAVHALAWSDRIAVLRNGQFVQSGTPSEVYDRPVDSYVAELTGDINWLGDSTSKQSFIRPEKLRKTRHPDKARWQGTVESVRFHGNYWEVVCQNKHDKLSFYRHRPDVAVGDAIMLTYSQKDLRNI